jgi:hypothetical protein
MNRTTMAFACVLTLPIITSVAADPPPPPATPITKPDARKFEPPAAPPYESPTKAASESAFSTESPETSSTAISLPQTLTYSGGGVGIFLTDTGTNKALEALISNTSNASSALYGQTNGSGAGVSGYNTGTSGVAGKFGVRNAANAQPAVFATTAGTGPALVATVSSSSSTPEISFAAGMLPAIFGQNTVEEASGIGVEGEGEYIGVEGIGTYRLGTGVYGVSAHGVGVGGESDDGTGVSGGTATGYALYGYSSGTGIAVFGQSASGYAGYFEGQVSATSYVTSSDRNAKTDITPIDHKAILRHVDELSITSWDFKSDPKKRHVGPMAQDFHAAFGLDGDDVTHINLTDMAGVSLAAIQELSREVHSKDLEIKQLRDQLAAQAKTVAALKSMAESFSARMATLEGQRSEVGARTVSFR